MLKSKKETVFWIFIVLFYLGYTYFIFTKPNLIESKNLIEIKAKLLEKPIINESTGDNVPSIVFKIINDNSSIKYRIESCGFEKTKQNDLLNLNYSDSIIFTTTKETTFYQKIVNKKEVFSLSSVKNNLELLSLKDYNSCEKSVWKEFFILTTLLFFLMTSVIIKNSKPNSADL